MPLSPLLTAILEQAREPLLCLHGAGYFSEEEWIQLDLIMNKKYVWTTGPKSRFQSVMETAHNVSKVARIEAKEPAIALSGHGEVRTLCSPEPTSTSTSVEQLSDGVKTSVASMDLNWDLSPAMASPAPLIPTLRKQAGPFRAPPNNGPSNGLAAGYTLEQVEEARILRTKLTKSKTSSVRKKSFSSLALEVHHEPNQNVRGRPITYALAAATKPNERLIKAPKILSQNTTVSSNTKDVDAFETSNAAEWDEEPSKQEKSQGRKDVEIIFEEKVEKIEDAVVRDNQVLKELIPTSSPDAPPILSSLEERKLQRTATVTRTIRRNARVLKEPKDSTYIPPLPKTKTCWFWAETAGGCRYRPEECLHLHVKPKPGMLPNYPLKDGKPTWGSLADATPQEVPEGKKPRSCWFWATKGVCGHGTDCKFVHAWVAGGVSSRPKNLDLESSDEEDSDDSYDNDDVDLSGKDVGDKAPSQPPNMDPKAIANRIHAPEWIRARTVVIT